MSTQCGHFPNATQRHQRARKVYVCDWCQEAIVKGSVYVLATEFPGGEAGYADSAGHPVSWRIHDAPPCHYCPGLHRGVS